MSGQQQTSKQTTSAPKQKICEKCGAKFDCYAPWGPCWCDDVKLRQGALANLRAQYNDCLCSNCLRAMAEKTKT